MLIIDRPATPAQDAPAFGLRAVQPGDGDAMAHILFAAFAAIHDRHRFARDFPTLDAAADLVGSFIGHPRIWGVVAERDGRVIGSNFLDERSPVMGVGPITVEPGDQTRGVGRPHAGRDRPGRRRPGHPPAAGRVQRAVPGAVRVAGLRGQGSRRRHGRTAGRGSRAGRRRASAEGGGP